MRCLAQGTPPHSPGSGGAGDQTSNLAVASQPAPPPELLPQLLQFLHIAQKTTLWWADDSLVVPGVRDGPVHAELVALQLVELVPGVRVLARPHHRGPNIEVLVKVLPADLTCTHTHTHTHTHTLDV